MIGRSGAHVHDPTAFSSCANELTSTARCFFVRRVGGGASLAAADAVVAIGGGTAAAAKMDDGSGAVAPLFGRNTETRSTASAALDGAAAAAGAGGAANRVRLGRGAGIWRGGEGT